MYQTMNNLFKTWCVVAAATAMTACTTHYRLTNVSRTRLVVDARYDVQPDAQAEAFLAPYKHKVDSVMGETSPGSLTSVLIVASSRLNRA